MKKAVILAAGVGKRLGRLTKDIPKCLLPIDSDNTLIDFSLNALKECGIKKLVIVTGFESKKLENHIKTKWQESFLVQFIFNDKFNEYNNIYSTYLARNELDDETVLLNSDIIFHTDILKTLSHKPQATRSHLVIDDVSKLDAEDMKVKINKKGEIKEINKKLNCEDSLGEYIGIAHLRGIERIKFIDSIENNVNDKHFDLYYEDALAAILNNSSVYPSSTKGLPWAEVDTEEDLKLAKVIGEQIRSQAKHVLVKNMLSVEKEEEKSCSSRDFSDI